MIVLTGNQCSTEALTHAGGFPKGVTLLPSALITSPPAAVRAFSLLRAFSRQGALASCRIAGEPTIARIQALIHRLSTWSSMRANEYLSAVPPGTSGEGKSRTYG